MLSVTMDKNIWVQSNLAFSHEGCANDTLSSEAWLQIFLQAQTMWWLSGHELPAEGRMELWGTHVCHIQVSDIVQWKMGNSVEYLLVDRKAKGWSKRTKKHPS